MNLQIRNSKAYELARRLAAARKSSITDAVIGALEAELKREGERRPLAERLTIIADELKAKAGRNGREMDKDEIDELWGHP